MKALVPSVLPHRELVKVILEWGLILFCGDRALTDGVISKQFEVGVCWGRSLMYRMNNAGSRTEPYGMPDSTGT